MNQLFGNMHGPDGKDIWLTPPEIVKSLGIFDLDPCAAVDQPWQTAKRHFTIVDDGLKQTWFGRVWMNPPYGSEAKKWLKKLVDHGNGMALIFARTETQAFFDYVWDKADAILFLKGRITFYNRDGTKAPNCSGAPSCLVAYGKENVDALKQCGLEGKLLVLK